MVIPFRRRWFCHGHRKLKRWLREMPHGQRVGRIGYIKDLDAVISRDEHILVPQDHVGDGAFEGHRLGQSRIGRGPRC